MFLLFFCFGVFPRSNALVCLASQEKREKGVKMIRNQFLQSAIMYFTQFCFRLGITKTLFKVVSSILKLIAHRFLKSSE